MQTTQLELDTAQNFLQAIESGKEFELPTPLETTTTDDSELDDSVVKSGQSLLDELDTKEKEEEQKIKEDLSNTEDLSKVLSEQGLIYAFEDGSLPKNREEFIEALKQSVEVNSGAIVDERFREKVEALPLSIQTIIEYGSSKLTSARDLQKFTNIIADFEDVNKLDITNVEDQEVIMLNQLLNTGLSDNSAKIQINILKDSGKLEEIVKEIYPVLKNRYKQEVERKIQDQNYKEENIIGEINNNSTNVRYFLDQDTDYIPFKIDSQQHKAAVFNLAAKVVNYDENTEPIYAWQEHIKGLQQGDEKSYKKFMKFMNFLANDEYYEKKLGKVSSVASLTKEVKKILVARPNSQNIGAQEGSAPRQTVQRQQGPLTID